MHRIAARIVLMVCHKTPPRAEDGENFRERYQEGMGRPGGRKNIFWDIVNFVIPCSSIPHDLFLIRLQWRFSQGFSFIPPLLVSARLVLDLVLHTNTLFLYNLWNSTQFI